MSKLIRIFLTVLAVAIILSPLLLVGRFILDRYSRSGSLSGDKALDHMRQQVLHGLGNYRWREVATEARAEWEAPDMNGDRIENYSFTLPTAEIATFESALEAEWTLRPLNPPSDTQLNYVFKGASLILNRSTGRVEIEWANFLNLTPTTKPATRASPTTSSLP